MRAKIALLLTLITILAWGSTAQASLIAQSLADDGDGVVSCSTYNFAPTGEPNTYELHIDGVQWRFEAGHILGELTTDTELDPTLKLYNEIDNDTDFAWTDYHLKLTMDKTFSIGLIAGSLDPNNWSTYVVQPTLVDGKYVGTIDYYAGTPVLVGDTFDFGYSVSFLGTVQFCQEMTPTPEPATMSLLALGGLAILRRNRRG